MPIIKSAKKRVRVATKATVRNRKTKRLVKSAIKTFNDQLSGSNTKAYTSLSAAQSAIDTAVKKGVMHKNKAARKKAQLAAQAKLAKVSIPKQKPVSKPKTTTKASVAKKPAAKKPPKQKTN